MYLNMSGKATWVACKKTDHGKHPKITLLSEFCISNLLYLKTDYVLFYYAASPSASNRLLFYI